MAEAAIDETCRCGISYTAKAAAAESAAAAKLLHLLRDAATLYDE